MKKSLFFGAMAAGLLFTGCSDDLKGGDEPKVAEQDHTLYVNMSIHGDAPSSRAASANGTPDINTDFDKGIDNETIKENGVNNAYFVFYDEDGQVVGELVPITLNNPQTAATPDGTVNTYYKSVVPVSVRKGEKDPAGVICYINPISPSSLQTTLDNIQTVTRERVTTSIGGVTYFGMSNSVYYANTTAEKPNITVPIAKGQLFNTAAEAEAATEEEAQVVDVYVERYATKLKFNAVAEENNVPYATTTTKYGATEAEVTDVPVVLTFVPQYWALNARATEGYVIKSFRRETESGEILADNYSYAMLNYRINVADPMATIDYGATTPGTALATNQAWAWNAPTYHRSYWGMSPAYFQNEYPEVASDVEKIAMPHQEYLTYAELGAAINPKGLEASNSSPQYFKETTVGTKALNSGNPAAAIASVIYVGQYKMTVDGEEVSGNPNFYTYLRRASDQHAYVYFDTDNTGNCVVPGGESMLKRFVAQSTILFTKDDEGVYHELGIEDYATAIEALEVAEITDDVKKVVDGTSNTELKLQANARSLQFKSAQAAQDAGIYIASGNGYKQVVADTATPTNDQIKLSVANSILMQQVGYAYYYSAGKGYFNIPVRHFGWYRVGNDNNKVDADGNPVRMNWNLVRVGDFGMVRNHSYEITVDKITTLAAGINGDNTPIVPPADTQDYYVSYRVNILKWAVVPTQHTNL